MAFDIKQQSRRLIEELWNQGKVDAIDEYVDASYVGQDPLLGTTNREGFRQSIVSYRRAFPDLKFQVDEIICEGDCALVRWTATGTHRGALLNIPATGRSATVTGMTLSEFRRGKVVRDRGEWNALGLFKQLGVSEMAPITEAQRQLGVAEVH